MNLKVELDYVLSFLEVYSQEEEVESRDAIESEPTVRGSRSASSVIFIVIGKDSLYIVINKE